MARRPAAPTNLRNGLKWRNGRPRWEPSPANRACGFSGMDLKDAAGLWLDRGGATTAADARTLWASVVREALRDTDAGSVARGHLRIALERLPPMPEDAEGRARRQLVADLIEHGRAALEGREPGVTAALACGPRTVKSMVEGFFGDAQAQARITAQTRKAYRTQSHKLIERFGPVRVDEITRPQMRRWYLDLIASVSIATANQAIGAAGAFFTWATWQDPAWLKDNPCTKLGRVSTPGRRVFWTVAEEQAFIPWCDANGYTDVADCVTVCLWTGARQIDPCAATLGDLEGKTWRYVPEKTKKNAQEALPGLLSPVTRRVERRRRELADHPLRHLNDPPFLWDYRTGRRHDSASIYRRFDAAKKAAIAAGVLPETFAEKRLQDTRDTCVTRLWAAFTSRQAGTQGKGALERIATWGGWALDTVQKILRDHYLSLLDEGAIESAGLLATWAAAQGFEVEAA